MEKSLTPLIIFLSLIIVLSIVFINITNKYAEKDNAKKRNFYKFQLGKLQKIANKNSFRSEKSGIKDLKVKTNYMLNWAEFYISMGENKKAENILRTLLIFEDENIRALENMATVCFLQKKHKETEFYLKKLIAESAEKGETGPLLYNDLSLIQAKNKKFAKALKNAKKAEKQNPHIPYLKLNIAGLYAEQNNMENAEKYIRRARYENNKKNVLKMYDPIFDEVRQISTIRRFMPPKIDIKSEQENIPPSK